MRLLRDRFRGAFADTGTAVNAFAFINVRFAIDHRDRLNRARACTGFASDALCFINLSCHDKILLSLKLSDFVDLDLGKILTVTCHLLIPLAAFLLEDKDLLTFA